MNSSLDLTFSALSDPTRRAILARLTQGEASVADLAQPFDISARAVSLHVGVLERAGLVLRSRDAQKRPARLDLSPLREVDSWLDIYRRIWEGRLDRMEEALRIIEQGGSRK